MMRLDPRIVQQQVENLKLLFPELTEDEDAWSLTIESETELLTFMDRIVNAMRDAASMASGIAGRITELEARQERYVRREQAMRVLAFNLMQSSNVKKLELQEATLSVRNGTPKVIITDEADLPADAFRVKKEPDKQKIKSWLDAGQEVPGAVISNAEPSLSVRTK